MATRYGTELPRQRSRECPQCSYLLDGAATGTVTCPECGSATDIDALDAVRRVRVRLGLDLMVWGIPAAVIVWVLARSLTVPAENSRWSLLPSPWPLLLPPALAALLGTGLLVANSPAVSSARLRRWTARLCVAAAAAACVISATASVGQVVSLEIVLQHYVSDIQRIHTLAHAAWVLFLIALIATAPRALADIARTLDLMTAARWLRRLPLLAYVLAAAWVLAEFRWNLSRLFSGPVPGAGPGTRMTAPWFSLAMDLVEAARPLIALLALMGIWSFVLIARAQVRHDHADAKHSA